MFGTHISPLSDATGNFMNIMKSFFYYFSSYLHLSPVHRIFIMLYVVLEMLTSKLLNYFSSVSEYYK